MNENCNREVLERSEYNDLQTKIFTGGYNTSLQPIHEVALSELLLADPNQSGEKMFALMAWATGATAEEILKIRWKDTILLTANRVNNEPINYYLVGVVSADTGIKRLIPIGSSVDEFLNRRFTLICNSFKKIKNEKVSNSEIAQMVREWPICCDGNDYSKPCSIENAQRTTNEVLLQAGVSKEVLRYLELYRKFGFTDREQRLETMTEVFLLRRSFGTFCHIAGLSSEETSYLMMLHVDNMSANDLIKKYNNPKGLYLLAKKLSLRPILNPIP